MERRARLRRALAYVHRPKEVMELAKDYRVTPELHHWFSNWHDTTLRARNVASALGMLFASDLEILPSGTIIKVGTAQFLKPVDGSPIIYMGSKKSKGGELDPQDLRRAGLINKSDIDSISHELTLAKNAIEIRNKQIRDLTAQVAIFDEAIRARRRRREALKVKLTQDCPDQKVSNAQLCKTRDEYFSAVKDVEAHTSPEERAVRAELKAINRSHLSFPGRYPL